MYHKVWWKKFSCKRLQIKTNSKKAGNVNGIGFQLLRIKIN